MIYPASAPSVAGNPEDAGRASSIEPNPPEVCPTAPRRSAALRVLVVEDQALIALALAADVAALGGEVVGRAAGGEVAVGLAGRQAPDLVLLDVHLAGDMDGIDAAARIQRECCEAGIVFITAYAEGADRTRMEALHPLAILSKPYAPEALADAVRICAARRWARRHASAAAGIAD
jgi:CheY-like chemotaxis protein